MGSVTRKLVVALQNRLDIDPGVTWSREMMPSSLTMLRLGIKFMGFYINQPPTVRLI